MRNIKITLEYDGSNYHGWQMQKNTPATIQEIVEEAIARVNKQRVAVTGASRTDAGVHALGQVANFSLIVDIPVQRIPLALNSYLPRDIVCKKAEEVAADFHARYDARGKKYRYRILNQELPSAFIRNYVFHHRRDLNLESMAQAAKEFIGTYDFKAFQSKGSEVTDTVRTISNCTVLRMGNEIWLEVEGSGFLYNMVRIIAGTLIEVGRGKKQAADIKEIIASKDRRKAGFTAPAQGLTLVKVYY